VEVFIEELSGGSVVAGRIVLRGNRSVREVARLSMTRADWEDFTRCLGHPGQVKQGRIVFTPVPKAPATPVKRQFSEAPHFLVDPGRAVLAASAS
jgi:hypothetical protein